MSATEKAFELSVVIHAIDKLTAPMKAMEASMKYAQGRMDLITKSMKMMGSSQKEIDGMQSSLDKLARTKSFGELADDLMKVGATSEQIQNLSKGMEKLATQQEKIEKLNKKLKGSLGVAAAGGVMTAGGIGMAHELMAATDEAGKLLTTMTTIRDASGATNQQMDSIKKTIQSTSAGVKFDQFEEADFAALLSTSGYNANQVNQLLPTFSKFAEVQQYGKGTSPDEAIGTAIQLAHSAGHYDADSLMQYLNNFNKATFLQPEDTAKFSETLKYLQPTALSMGMNDQDSLFMAALSNRMGLAGSMGGTNAADLLMRAIPGLSGGLKQKTDGTFPKQLQAMMNLGLADSKGNSPFFQDGKLIDLQGFITELVSKTANISPEERMKDFHDIFGIQGARAAQLFGSEKGFEQLQALQNAVGTPGKPGYVKDINQMQEDYLKTPEGQLNQLKSNLQNIKMNFLLEIATNLNPLLLRLNGVVTKVLAFTNEHPKVAKYAATFALIATSVLLIAGPLTSVIGLIGMMRAGLSILATAKGFEGILPMFRALGAFLLTNPIALAIAGIAIAGFLIYKNWSTIGPFVKKLWGDVIAITQQVWKTIGPTVMKGVQSVTQTFQKAWKGIVDFGKAVWPDLLKIIKFIWPLISATINYYIKFIERILKFGGTVIVASFKAAWTILSAIVKVAWTLIKDIVKFGWDLVSSVIKIGLKLLTGDWKGAWDLIKSSAKLLWQDMKVLFNDGWKGIVTIAKAWGTAAKQWGMDIVHGLINGIKGVWSDLGKTVKDLASNYISGPIKKMLGINSPSRVMMENGKYITQGLAMGMTQNAGMVNQAANQIATLTLGAGAFAQGGLGSGTGGGDTYISVHPHPHQRVEEIVDEIERRQGKRAMRKNMATGVRLAPGSF